MELTKVNAEDFGLTKEQGQKITSKFEILTEEKEVLLQEYSELIKKELTVDLSIEANELDKKLQKHLKSKKDIHTANKAFFLSGGRFVDSIYNVEKVEFNLMREKTKAIKDYAKNLEIERLKQLQEERLSLIKGYVDEIDIRDYSLMDDDVWEAYYQTKKKALEDRLKSEKEEAERLRKENEEKEMQAAEDKAERERLEKEAQLIREKAKKERLEREEKEALRIVKEEEERLIEKAKADKIIADLKEKADKEKAKAKAIEDKAKAEREALEKQIAEKKAQEEKAEKERLEAIELELKKGDSEKVEDLIYSLEFLKSKYNFKSKKNQKTYNQVGQLIDKVINHIKD